MRLKRTLALGAAGGALAAWLAAAATTGARYRPVLPPSSPSSVDARSADLTREVERLHERLRPTSAPRQPSRNLFEFSATPRVASVDALPAARAALTEAAAVAPPAAPPLKLAGIAEDASDNDGVARTAIISVPGQVVLAKQGDRIASRYRVDKIGADAVELTDLATNTAIRLVLK